MCNIHVQLESLEWRERRTRMLLTRLVYLLVSPEWTDWVEDYVIVVYDI